MIENFFMCKINVLKVVSFCHVGDFLLCCRVSAELTGKSCWELEVHIGGGGGEASLLNNMQPVYARGTKNYIFNNIRELKK